MLETHTVQATSAIPTSQIRTPLDSDDHKKGEETFHSSDSNERAPNLPNQQHSHLDSKRSTNVTPCGKRYFDAFQDEPRASAERPDCDDDVSTHECFDGEEDGLSEESDDSDVGANDDVENSGIDHDTAEEAAVENDKHCPEMTGINEDQDFSNVDARTSNSITGMEYTRFRLHTRPQEYNIITRAFRLFEEFVVDCYVKVTNHRLAWYSQNQDKCRVDKYIQVRLSKSRLLYRYGTKVLMVLIIAFFEHS